MQKNLRPFLIEISWILMSILLTLLITGFIFDWSFPTTTVDVHMHDTYFIVPSATIVIPLFLLLTIMVFCVKEISRRFNRTLPNIVIILCGLLLIIYLTDLSKTL